MIEEKETLAQEKDELINKELVEQKLLCQYWKFKDIFSKAASDILLSHWLYDYKIEIEQGKENTLSFSPLYQQSIAELKATKQYLIEHLGKGFIEPSQAPFALPILFVKKPNGGLCFYINYCKLNNMTRKNHYLLPLLDETLAWISKAKVFIKLDICQAFHWIKIDLGSKDLTTF